MKTRRFVVLVPITLFATASTATPAEKWALTEERAFRSEFDGSEQRYVVMLPEPFDAQREHHLLIVLHGHGSDRWQYVRQARGECAGARDVALKHDMIYLSPDYRAPDSWMGPAAESDLVQIIRHAHGAYRIGKVILGGGSMGGTGALIFAALHPDLVDGVVSQNGTANMLQYAKFQDSIARSYGGTKAEKPEEYRQRSPELVPERFKMPVAVTTGGKDTLVPADSVLRLADALKKTNPDVLVIHRDSGGHATNYEDTVAAYEFVIGRAVARSKATAKGSIDPVND